MAQDGAGIMVEFAIEPMSYLRITGLENLTKAAWHEAVEPTGIFDYLPNWDRYQQMEDSANLRFFSVRDDNILVGYAVVIIDYSLIDRHKKVGLIHSIYIRPENRIGCTGVQFIKFIEQQLYDIKVMVSMLAECQNGAGKVYQRMLNYTPQEIMWVKSLGGA